MKEYVAGFLFDHNRQFVILVLKNHPRWQNGKMNGVGGHIEEGENAEQAMEREFREETCMSIKDWELFAKLGGEDNKRPGGSSEFRVYFFRAFRQYSDIIKCCGENDVQEAIIVQDIKDVTSLNCIPNVPWLIQMGKYIDHDHTTYFEVIER